MNPLAIALLVVASFLAGMIVGVRLLTIGIKKIIKDSTPESIVSLILKLIESINPFGNKGK